MKNVFIQNKIERERGRWKALSSIIIEQWTCFYTCFDLFNSWITCGSCHLIDKDFDERWNLSERKGIWKRFQVEILIGLVFHRFLIHWPTEDKLIIGWTWLISVLRSFVWKFNRCRSYLISIKSIFRLSHKLRKDISWIFPGYVKIYKIESCNRCWKAYLNLFQQTLMSFKIFCLTNTDNDKKNHEKHVKELIQAPERFLKQDKRILGMKYWQKESFPSFWVREADWKR